ncbi:MAG TPA: oligosaccharide flippase family protein [Thermoleophilaceae bacterium]|nr:oligosaccharide flippase family protein [Thermoleophilaceae bacterium]
MSSHSGAGGARRIFKNTAVLMLARVISRVSTLVLTLMIAAWLGADDLGVFSAALAVWGALTIASEAGAVQYLIRELSKDPSLTGRYVVHLSAVAVPLALVVTLLAELVVRNVGYSSDLERGVSIVLLGVLPRVLNGIQTAAFIAHGRTEFETIPTFLTNAIHIAVSAVLLATGHGVEAVLISFVAMHYLATACYFTLIARYIARLPLELDFRLMGRLVTEVKAFAATSALAALFSRPEVILLSLFASPAQVGYYSAAMRVAEVWLFVPQVFMSNVYSALSRSEHQRDGRFLPIQGKAIKYTLAFSLPLTAGMVAAADPIIATLFGEGFQDSVVPLQLLAVSLTFASLMEVFWPSLFARGRQASVLRIQLMMLAVRLGVGSWLAASLAALGAAISALASSVVHLGLLIAAARRHGGHAPIVSSSWRLVLAAAATGAVTWVVADLLDIWLAIPVAAASYFAAAVVLRAFSAEDVSLFRSLLPARRA